MEWAYKPSCRSNRMASNGGIWEISGILHDAFAALSPASCLNLPVVVAQLRPSEAPEWIPTPTPMSDRARIEPDSARMGRDRVGFG